MLFNIAITVKTGFRIGRECNARSELLEGAMLCPHLWNLIKAGREKIMLTLIVL
jgi:hypothetical protein